MPGQVPGPCLPSLEVLDFGPLLAGRACFWANPLAGSGLTGAYFWFLDSGATVHFILLAFQPSLLPGAQPLPSRSSRLWLTVRESVSLGECWYLCAAL
jgi:hypothetical protein